MESINLRYYMQTKGHLAGTQGGIRGHSAGPIFPYIIAIQGGKYHLIGNGVIFGAITAPRNTTGYDTLTAIATTLSEWAE